MLLEDIPRTALEAIIDEWTTGPHGERDRRILKRRLIDGICYEPLAEEFDLSVPQIKRIVYKRLARLARHLN